MPVALELRGRERLDALVDLDTDAPKHAKGKVVRGEPFQVASDRLAKPAEPHADDHDH